MNDRPTGVSIFGWMGLLSGVAGVFASIPMAQMRGTYLAEYWTGPVYEWLLALSDPSFALVYGVTSAFFGWVGWALLKGRNWARVATLVACVVSLGLAATMDPTTPGFWWALVFGASFTGAYALALYGPEGKEFFARSEANGASA